MVWVYLHSHFCSGLQTTLFCNRVHFGRSTSSKVDNFGTNRKRRPQHYTVIRVFTDTRQRNNDAQLKQYIDIYWKVSPPPVSNKGTRCDCSLARTFMNFWKSATLLRVRNSSSLSLRSRGCGMFIRCSLCVHVIHPTEPSSLINVTSASIRSSSWIPLTDSLRIRASSKGRTSPYSAGISAV